MKIIKKLLIALLIIVGIIAIAIVGVYIYVRTTYEIDLFRTIGQMNTLSQTVDENVLCPNAFSDEDMEDVQLEVNSSVENFISYSEQDGYTVDLDLISSTMGQDIKLTDKQVGALADTVLKQEMGSKIEVAGKEIAIQLKQVKFSELSNGNVVLNTVIKLDITTIKADLSGFPFNLLKNLIPDYLYLSSTVTVVKGDEAFSYSTAQPSLALNNLDASETDDLFHTLDVVLKIGSASELNAQITDTFLDALIGNETNKGFAYSLKDLGATDYAFIMEGEQIYFSVTD
ncbi:MAG: hypothetical protein ACI4VK_00645 [Candidatus Coproplasma sp.]